MKVLMNTKENRLDTGSAKNADTADYHALMLEVILVRQVTQE
jgi:hypothetical protein